MEYWNPMESYGMLCTLVIVPLFTSEDVIYDIVYDVKKTLDWQGLQINPMLQTFNQ